MASLARRWASSPRPAHCKAAERPSDIKPNKEQMDDFLCLFIIAYIISCIDIYIYILGITMLYIYIYINYISEILKIIHLMMY